MDSSGRKLRNAAERGELDQVRELVERGADLDKEGLDGASPALSLAAWGDHLPVVQCLVTAGADKDKGNRRHGQTPLIMAANNGFLPVVQYLVKAGADKDKADMLGETPLFVAAYMGRLPVVRYLVEQHADKDKAVPQGAQGTVLAAGDTPLLWAAKKCHLRIAQYLVEAGASLAGGRRRDRAKYEEVVRRASSPCKVPGSGTVHYTPFRYRSTWCEENGMEDPITLDTIPEGDGVCVDGQCYAASALMEALPHSASVPHNRKPFTAGELRRHLACSIS